VINNSPICGDLRNLRLAPASALCAARPPLRELPAYCEMPPTGRIRRALLAAGHGACHEPGRIGRGCRPCSYSSKCRLHVGQRTSQCTAAVRMAIRMVARDQGVWRSGRSGASARPDLECGPRTEPFELLTLGGKTESALSEQQRESSQAD
jgi:hypothetical protein